MWEIWHLFYDSRGCKLDKIYERVLRLLFHYFNNLFPSIQSPGPSVKWNTDFVNVQDPKYDQKYVNTGKQKQGKHIAFYRLIRGTEIFRDRKTSKHMPHFNQILSSLDVRSHKATRLDHSADETHTNLLTQLNLKHFSD